MDALVKTKRRKWYEPSSTDRYVTPGSYETVWFQKLHEHGPLPTHYLSKFVEEFGLSESTLKHRLGNLYHETNTPQGGRYLDRPEDQNKQAKHLNRIHQNGRAAEEYLKANNLIPHTAVPTKQTNFPHQFMTSCITASIELACRERGIEFVPRQELLKKSPTGSLKLPTEFSYKGKPYSIPVVPDGYFGLRYPNGQVRAFLVEADRGEERIHTDNMETQRSYLRKILQYQYLLTRHNEQPAPYHKYLGINSGIVVLNVTNLYGRLDNLLAEVMAVNPRGSTFMAFKTMPVFADKLAVPDSILTDLLNTPWRRAGHPDLDISVP